MLPRKIGFVPTMGALHAGHISLIKASLAENDLTVCSIYVNPTQFNNPKDLQAYPETLERDTELLKAAGCDILFCPPHSEMYPNQNHIRFDFGILDKVLEGEFRPGHFSGVALVVSKLFNIVAPDRAYFGQKDFQQLKIVEKLVSDLNFNLTVRSGSIVREEDGLAMSSRNARLTGEQRSIATVFYESLKLAQLKVKQGESMQKVVDSVKVYCESKAGVKLEYLALADHNLTLIQAPVPRSVLLIAGYIGEVRLIDNLLVYEN